MNKFIKLKYHFILGLAGLLWGTVSLFSGLLTREQVDVFSQILYRAIFGAITTLVIAKYIFKRSLLLRKSEMKYVIVNSFLTLGGWTFFMISIFVGTPIAKATVLMYTYPIYTVILSLFLLKEKPSIKNCFGIILSFMSVLILLEVWNIKNLNQIQLGDVFALIDALFTASVIVYGRKIRTVTKIDSFNLFTFTLLFMMPLLFFFGFILQAIHLDLLRPIVNLSLTPNAWLYAVGIGVFGTALTFPLLYTGLSKVKTLPANILLLFEVVASYIFGIVVFGETFSIWGFVGMIGIILSTLLV